MFNDYFHSVFLTEGDDISIPTTPVCEETISDIILDPSEVYRVYQKKGNRTSARYFI